FHELGHGVEQAQCLDRLGRQRPFWRPQLRKEIRKVGDPPCAQALQRATLDDAGLAEGLYPGPEGQELLGFVRLADQRLSPPARPRLPQGGDQPRFANPGLAENRDDLTMARTRLGQRLGQAVDLGLASNQRGRDASRAAMRAKAPSAWVKLWVRV